MIERGDLESTGWGAMWAEHVGRYLFAGGFVNGKTVVDVGTGPGYGAVLLKDAGARSVLGVDLDADTVASAAKKFTVPGVRFAVDNAQSLERVEAPVDVIVSFENIEHLDEPLKFLERAAALLAPDGLLICSTPDRAITPPFVAGKPANPFHKMEWYRDEFTAMLTRSFDRVETMAQVVSHACAARQRAVNGLRAHLEYLWGNPVRRATRALLGPFGRRVEWGPTSSLSARSLGDVPIVSVEVAPIFGQPLCHVAVCRSPRK